MRKTTALMGAVLALGSMTAAAEESINTIRDETTRGRKLLQAPRPEYPPQERGRWTESCVALYFKVRPDGQTDEFMVLEAPRYKKPRDSNLQTESEKAEESRNTRLFVQPALTALFDWRYEPAAQATEEIAVFRFERTEMGGHLMRLSARRLDLDTPNAKACTTPLDVKQIKTLIAKSRPG